MKKAISLCLFLISGLLLISCSSQNSNVSETPSDSSSQNASGENSGSHTDEESKILVAYFSATGNTRSVAESIAETLNADLFEILPAEPYTDDDLDYSHDDCRANQEQNDPEARPVIASSIENMDDYQTVFIGFPIWWGEEPRIIDTFAESYDFSGKTLALFCTSESSGIDTSESNLQTILGEDISLAGSQRFPQGSDSDVISDWLAELNL